jgi:molybdopterin-guanine dinucleotide biosynthesis protein A
MGTDKALLEVDGRPMGDRVASALDAAGCAPVLLVGGDAVRLSGLGRAVIADRWPGEGPAGGVLTALAVIDDDLVVVAACDLPALDAATVRAVLDAAAADPSLGAAVAVTDRPQRSLTAWRRAVARPPLEAAWAAGARSVRALLDAVHCVEVAVPVDRLRNVNTPAEHAEAIGRRWVH